MTTGQSVESTICDIFAGVLGLGTVEPTDDFFELGGHSLLASRVAAKVRQETGVRIRLVDFIGQPTARRMAELVQRASDDSTGARASGGNG
ncbi:hypothetical protein Lfu02_74930 [Longispora fulva]|uniref:Acyl carrier protein n=1 Tax=Longispora fulva TaxID=619741 RepID=A0A8J7G9M7_9ACTN|nr:phosphopantetheine-binding protein [Longispora fulva]MBG6134229.1 acyl carrier protein [Longispora fulva]GIG63121.1 hypothetical protein Lfu02_74930 [Longispora fulva]